MIKIEDPSSSEISDVFIPREYWVSDEEATRCFSCKVHFDLLHRRHHCRMCGNVFDTKCANNFLTPPTFIFEKERKIRVCDECHKKAVSYLSRGANTSRKGLSMTVRQSSTRLLEVETLTSDLLTGKLYSLSEEILSYFLRDNGCYDKWFVVLKDLIKECMELVQPTNVRCDHIDMKKFIKIKKVPYKDMSLTRLVQGLIIRKNVINKKMGSSFENPTILMIKGNLENRDNEACVLDANSIKKENAYLEDVVNKILKIDPTIVIIEGTVGRTVQDKLANLNKALLVRFRKSQFNKIAACVGAQPIEDLYSFEALNPNHLGTCEKFYIAKYKNKEYYNEVRNFRPDEFSDQSDYSMLFLEGCNSIQKRATVLISGPDYQELVKVKKILQETFQILRNLFLERAIISQEALLLHTKDRLWKLLVEDDVLDGAGASNDIREALKVEAYQRERVTEIAPTTCLLNQITAATAGYMLSYLTERISIATIIQKTSFMFSKMLLVPNLSPPLMDLTSRGPESQPIIDSALKRSKAWYKQDLCSLHKKPKVLRVYYSSKEDATLYVFLSGFAERAFEKCETCNRKYCGHLTYFFIQQFYVQISVDLKAGSKTRRKNHSLSVREHSKSEIGPRIEAHPGSFFNLLTTPAFEAPRKDSSPLSKSSTENPMKMGDVYMYIECSCCKTRLSDVIKVKKAFLNYSFSRYLESLTNSAERHLGYLMDKDFNPKSPGEDYPNEFLQSLKNLPFKSSVKPCCLYSPKNRVFVVDNLLIRFQVGLSKPYNVDLNGITSQETAGFCHATEQELIKTKKAEFLELVKNYLRLVIANMNQMFLYLIQRSGLDLTIATIFSAENILNENNPLTQEPSNILLLSLIPLYKELMDINKEFEETSKKEIHDHLEIEIWRRSFCEHIRNIYDSIEQAKIKYQESTTANGPIRNNSILEEHTENDYFELIDQSGSPTPTKTAQLKNGDFSSQSKAATSIKVEVEALVVNGEYDMQKEAIYAQQATTGAYFYVDDLEYEQYIKFKFIPMFENKPLSILAYCLNSPKYMKEVYMAEEFNNFEKYIHGLRQASTVPEYKKFISSKLLCENTETLKQFQVKSPSIEIQLKFFNNLSDSISGRRPKFIPAVRPRKIFDTEIIEDFVGSIQMGKVPKKEFTFSEKYVTPKFNIIIHYPVQFEALRNCCGIGLSEFLSSISYSKDWEENSGGRTGASFIKSYDQKFVFKRLEKKEFMMLLGFAEEYFKYMWKVCGEGKHSVIAKIYGVFEILDEKQMSCYYIAMENILHNTPSKIKMYDLKGSELNRYVNNNGETGKTLLDTNYILDRNSQPLPIKSKNYEVIEQAIKNDCEFLCNLKVVDYSLLLVQDEKNGILKMGIIDYLRLYDFEKQLEHMGKKIMKGATPTIIRPEEYKKRFTKAMKRYFMNVSCE